MTQLNNTRLDDKVYISFTRKKYSKITCNFLCSKAKDPEIIQSITNLTTGSLKSLKVNEANSPVKVLLRSIIINGDLEDDDIESTTGDDNDVDEDLEEITPSVH